MSSANTGVGAGGGGNKRKIFVCCVSVRVSERVSARALLPLGGGKVSGTLGAVPGAVRVPGQAALGAGFPVHLAAVQGHLRDAQSRAQVQLLLQTQKPGGNFRALRARPHFKAAA